MSNDPLADIVEMVGNAICGVTEAMAKTWDEAMDEAGDRGWMHDYAVAEMKERNPYRNGDEA